jgi:pimeloyl-ACP methyl ester carboxylesterase
MPYANNNGVKIYYEVEGQGPPLVLAYGLTGGLNCWRWTGIVGLLRNDFQLILFDARGHGKSDKPHEVSAYGLNMAQDVVAVLDDLRINQAHYFGYSMGARVGYWLAVRHTTRFRSFILGGSSPYRSEAVIKLEDELMEVMKRLPNDPERDELLRDNDAQALIALVTAFGAMPLLTDHELSLVSMPVLVFCGDADPRHSGARESANRMPKAKFVSLPGLDHVEADVCLSDVRNALVLPHIKEFLAQVSKA